MTTALSGLRSELEGVKAQVHRNAEVQAPTTSRTRPFQSAVLSDIYLCFTRAVAARIYLVINMCLCAWSSQVREGKVKYDEFVHQCIAEVVVHATRLTKTSHKAAIEEPFQLEVRVAYLV